MDSDLLEIEGKDSGMESVNSSKDDTPERKTVTNQWCLLNLCENY